MLARLAGGGLAFSLGRGRRRGRGSRIALDTFRFKKRNLHWDVFVVGWIQRRAVALDPLRGDPVKNADHEQDRDPAPRTPTDARLVSERQMGLACGGR